MNGTTRHISKVRNKKGTEVLYGFQFDLATRALAAEIESLWWRFIGPI